jgi:hypothetical protein
MVNVAKHGDDRLAVVAALRRWRVIWFSDLVNGHGLPTEMKVL